MLTVHFIRECSMLAVEPYQILIVFILFHYTIHLYDPSGKSLQYSHFSAPRKP